MQLNISDCYGRSVKNWRFSGWCLACAEGTGEKRRCRASLWYAGTADSHWRRQIVRISLALLPIHFCLWWQNFPRCI